MTEIDKVLDTDLLRRVVVRVVTCGVGGRSVSDRVALSVARV